MVCAALAMVDCCVALGAEPTTELLKSAVKLITTLPFLYSQIAIQNVTKSWWLLLANRKSGRWARRAIREEQELRGGAHKAGDAGEAVVHGELGGGARAPIAHVARVPQVRRERRLDH